MILVTGGTGLVGSHLLYHLSLENETIRAIYRVKSSLEKVRKVFSYYTQKLYVNNFVRNPFKTLYFSACLG